MNRQTTMKLVLAYRLAALARERLAYHQGAYWPGTVAEYFERKHTILLQVHRAEQAIERVGRGQ